MPLNQLLEWDAHLLLHSAGPVDVTADAEQLGAAVVLAAKAGKPLRSSAQDGWTDCHSLYISDSGGTTIQTNTCREGGLEAGLALQQKKRQQQH